jgi:CHAD domain-containing protein
VPVAELRTRRHGRRVDGAEVTLDEVRVMDAQRVIDEFSEIEVEGEPSTVRSIAKQLRKTGATAVDLTPKLFRALPLPARAAPQTPFETFRALLREQLDAILANDPGVRLGGDDENVHKMRVATRRARALLRAAAPLFTGDVQMLSAELKWLGGVLGDVRDLDVLLAHLSAEADELPPADAVAAHRLLRGIRRNRSRLRRTLLRALDSPRYASLLDRFEETSESLEPSGDDTPLRKLAQRELKKLRRDVENLPDDAPDEQLHAIRKRGKRARYAFELAGDDKTVRRAKELQDVLGEHQDSVVAEEQLRALAAQAAPEQALAAGLLIARERDRRARTAASWRPAFERL